MNGPENAAPPLTTAEIRELAIAVSSSVHDDDPMAASHLADALVKAMGEATTREGQDKAGAEVLRWVVVRCCRLSRDECARRCANKPGSCDTYGDGIESDGMATRCAGRQMIDGVLVLDLRAARTLGKAP